MDPSPPLIGRVYESSLDTGWRRTSKYGTQLDSAWNITGGRLENPTADTISYVQSETPAYTWFTNPLAGSSAATHLEVSFDFSTDGLDTLTAHFWAAQTGGTPTTTRTWISSGTTWT